MSSFAIEKSQELQKFYYSLVFLLKVEKQIQAYCILDRNVTTYYDPGEWKPHTLTWFVGNNIHVFSG